MNRTIISAASAAILAGGAAAQGFGDVLFIEANGVENVEWIDVSNGNNRNVLIDFDENNTAGQLLLSMGWGEQGQGGDLILGVGSRDVNVLTELVSVSNPFSITNRTSTTFASGTFANGDVLGGPLAVAYNPSLNEFGVANSPQPGNAQGQGFVTVQQSGSAALVFNATGLNSIVADINSSDYFVLSDSGAGSGFSQGILWRIDDANNATRIFDGLNFAAGVTDVELGLAPGETLDRMRGLTQITSGQFAGDLVVSNIAGGGNRTPDGALYRLDLDSLGNVVDVVTIADGLLAPNNVRYDFTSDTLVFHEAAFDREGDGTLEGRIVRYDLQGNFIETLVEDVDVRDILIVPTPGSAAVFALAGVAASRRRRA